jgi:hypothetical protein
MAVSLLPTLLKHMWVASARPCSWQMENVWPSSSFLPRRHCVQAGGVLQPLP